MRFDLAVGKTFPVTERLQLEFRAEGFNLLNHHNLYVNGLALDVANFVDTSGTPLPIRVSALKGGLGNAAIGGNHDERRFGQLALRIRF